MPSLEDLRLRTGQLIVEQWFDTLVDALENLTYDGAVDLYGYVHKHLIPIGDLILNLGLPTFRFKEIHVETVYYKNLVPE
jgi:hypothetical protein